MEVFIEETVVSLGLTRSPYLWRLSDAGVLEDHGSVHRRDSREFRPTNSPYLWSLSDAAVLEDHANVHRRECSEFRPNP